MPRFAFFLIACLYAYTSACAQGTGDAMLAQLRNRWYEVTPANGRYIVSTGPLATLFSRDGQPLFPFAYTKIAPGLDGTFIANDWLVIDSNGNELRKFQSPVLYADQQNRRYRLQTSYAEVGLYDAAGNNMKWVADTAQWRRNLVQVPARDGFILADTTGTPLSNKAGRVSVGKELFAITANDTAWLYNMNGELMCTRPADECIVFPNDMIAVKMYNLWALMGTDGKLLTDFKYGKPEDHKYRNAVEAQGILIDSSGREVIKSKTTYNSYHEGGWTEAGYHGDIFDEHFNLVFRDGSYSTCEFVGDRYIVFDDETEGRQPRTYDMVARTFVPFVAKEQVGNDAYLVMDARSKRKWVMRNGKMLPLPPFNKIDRKEYNDFYTIERNERTGTSTDTRYGEPIEYTADIYGVLDANMELLVPMEQVNVTQAPFGHFVTLRYDSAARYTLYTRKGKPILQSNEEIVMAHVGQLATARSGSTTLLINDTGIILRSDCCIISCLFDKENEDNRFVGMPALLAMTDSNNNTGIYSTGGALLLPHQYHVVDKKSKSALTLKKDDSLYFIDYRGRLLFNGRGFDGRNTLLTDGLVTITRDASQKWGIGGPEGETIAPHIYDTAYRDSKGNCFVGRERVMYRVENTGSLMPVATEADSARKKEETAKMMRKRIIQWGEQFPRVLAPYDGFSIGVYGNDGNRLLPYVPRCMVTSAIGSNLKPILAYIDTVTNEAVVVDANGQPVIPRMPRPAALVLNQYAITAIYRNKKDVLYNLEGDKMTAEIVTVDEPVKNELMRTNRDCGITIRRSVRCRLADGRQCLAPFYASMVVAEKTDSMSEFAGMAYVVTKTGTGLKSFGGEWMCPPVCDSIVWRNGIFWLYKGQKKGARGPNGRPMILPEYDGIYKLPSYENVFMVKKNGKYSIMNNRAEIISRGFDSISMTRYAALRNVPAWSGDTAYLLWLDRNGNVAEARDTLPPVKITNGETYINPLAIVKENGKSGLWSNTLRRWLLVPQYERVETGYDHDNFVAWKSTQAGNKKTDTTIVVDLHGERLLTVPGLCMPRRQYGDLWMLGYSSPRLADATGKIIVPGTYDEASAIGYGLLQVTQKDEYGGKTGLITRTGKVALKPQFDEIEEIAMGYMQAGKDYEREDDDETLVCLLGPTGKKLTAVKYDEIEMVRNDGSEYEQPMFIVKRKGQHGIVDSNGRTLVKCAYTAIKQVYRYKLAVVQDSTGKYGAITLGRKALTPMEYDFLGFFVHGMASFTKNGRRGWIDMKGKEYYPAQ